MDFYQRVSFRSEYAKSGYSECRSNQCKQSIRKNELRIGYRIQTRAEEPYVWKWCHFECFFNDTNILCKPNRVEQMDSFCTMRYEDQQRIENRIQQYWTSKSNPKTVMEVNGMSDDSNGMPHKRHKTDDIRRLREQSDLFYKCIAELKTMDISHVISLMAWHDIGFQRGDNTELYERLADAMVFGKLEKCPQCGEGQLVFRNCGYKCEGWPERYGYRVKCDYNNIADRPDRSKFEVPEPLPGPYDYVKKYRFLRREFEVRERLYYPALIGQKPMAPIAICLSMDDKTAQIPVLKGYRIVSLISNSKVFKKRLISLGANVGKSINKTTLCIISTNNESERESEPIAKARNLSIPIISEHFLEDIENGSEPMDALHCNRLNDTDIKERFVRLKPINVWVSSQLTVRLAYGGLVDPTSLLNGSTHVYKVGTDAYNTVLLRTDVDLNINRYYILQLLKDDSKDLYYLWRSWGIVGVNPLYGGNLLEDFQSISDALNAFETLYQLRTNERNGETNKWKNRNKWNKFITYPDCFTPIDVDFGADTKIAEYVNDLDIESKLSKPIQDLIPIIFETERMKNSFIECELDLDLMPFGPLSGAQLNRAEEQLRVIEELVRNKSSDRKALIAATNHFYTLFPNNFGQNEVPLIDTEELIQRQRSKLDSLKAHSFDYNIKHSNEGLDSIDKFYKYLSSKTKIEVMDRKDSDYQMIEKYAINTQQSDKHRLEVIDVFRIERIGENERFEEYKRLDNRWLLWHGSGADNFSRILTDGLRMAPIKARKSGYDFGKGIYFADMVTGSSKFCCAQKFNNICLLVLCDVILGKPLELYSPTTVYNLPEGKHSIKACGDCYVPDMDECIKWADGVTVPSGRPKRAERSEDMAVNTPDCNEYIVYNESQVNLKFLVKCKYIAINSNE